MSGAMSGFHCAICPCLASLVLFRTWSGPNSTLSAQLAGTRLVSTEVARGHLPSENALRATADFTRSGAPRALPLPAFTPFHELVPHGLDPERSEVRVLEVQDPT